MKKIVLAVLVIMSIASMAFATTPTISAQNTNNTNNYNSQFNTGVADLFGNYPNADIYYDGTNLVIDILHGGGTVSFPHGASIGSLTPAGMMTFSSGGAVTAAAYQIGRDNSGTNEAHINVPTGAALIFSVNGTTAASFNSTTAALGALNITTTGTINAGGITGTGFAGPLVGNVTGNVLGNINGTVGGITPAAGAFTTVAASSTIKSTSATGVGAHKLSSANQACNTTCSSGGCLYGFDLAAGASQPVLVECADASADTCLCMF